MTNEEKQRKIAEENKKLNSIREQANLYAGELPDFAKEWMKKRLESYAIKHDYNLPPANDIKNAMDWLHGLQESDPKLAGKIDRISWEAGQQHQQKWHDDLAKKAEKLSKFEGNPDDITPMIKYEDGFQWVKLNTPEAKDFEGNAMGNCVGKGGYDDKTIFSLRDKDNFPHVTVEYDEKTKTIEQMKCKGNSEVTDDYMPVVRSLINELKPERIEDIDYATSKDGEYYLGINEIKQALVDGIKLDEINISGNYAVSKNRELYVGNNEINKASHDGVMFDKVKILGDYALSKEGKLYHNDRNRNVYDMVNDIEEGVKFETIRDEQSRLGPYALAEDGKVYLGEDAIKNIPEGVVLKYVNIEKCKNITEWNHKVTGNFNAPLSGLTKIGPNAEFGGDVDIRDCKITEWNHKVPGDFYANDSGLTTIGPDAEFGGSVFINNCNITEFNNKVKGNFYADESSLTNIGPNAEFGAYVSIEGCKNLTEFNNKVEEKFYALGSGLTTFGPNAEFKGDVDIRGTPLSKEIGMYVIKTSEKKQAFADAIKSMDSQQEHTPEQAPEPEEETRSMSM